MNAWDPMASALVASVLAAVAAALGVVPFRVTGSVAPSWVGIAQALASGLMLGIGYLLLFQGLQRSVLAVMLGASAGLAYTLAVQTLVGIRELHREHGHRDDPSVGYRALLQGTLHSASEGLAIGTAMAVSIELGCFMAAALALHNVAESMALTQVLLGNRLQLTQLASLAVVSKSSQVLLALLALLLLDRLGGQLPLMLGFAAGSLFYLVLTELLPEAYENVPRRGIAAATSVAAATVVLLEGVLV